MVTVISAGIDAAEAIAELGALKERVRNGVRAAVSDGAARLLSLVQAKLSGEVLQPRSGALLRSIRTETTENADDIAARVFSDGTVAYARIQEYGGRIALPEIVPRAAKVLVFPYGGRMIFVRRAAAHSIDIPERSYLRASLDEFESRFLDDIRRLTVQ